ncbi:MAG: ester cyclase [Acidimicrobiales bacterium]
MREARELIRSYVAAGDAGDYDALRRVLHPDVVTHSPGGITSRGVDDQIAAWRAAHDGLDELTHEIVAIVGDGEAAAARVRAGGVHRGRFLGIDPTGNEIRVDQALFVRSDGSRIVEVWEVVDTGAGFRQLGVLADYPSTPGTDDGP